MPNFKHRHTSSSLIFVPKIKESCNDNKLQHFRLSTQKLVAFSSTILMTDCSLCIVTSLCPDLLSTTYKYWFYTL